MAKLYFKTATMNSGKSTDLIQTAYNYQEKKMTVLVLKPRIDTREKDFAIHSRIGAKWPAVALDKEASLFDLFNQREINESNIEEGGLSLPHVILVDEAQFLEPRQVYELRAIVDRYNIPVICYGLRTDFKRDLFPGSSALLGLADKIEIRKTMCWCGAAAGFVLRLDDKGNKVSEGPQVMIGGNDQYVSVCSYHWTKGQGEAPTVGDRFYPEILQRYKSLILEKESLLPITEELKEESAAHLLWMINVLSTNEGQTFTKKHRWLGYIQGVLCTHKLTDVNTERNLTRGIFNGD